MTEVSRADVAVEGAPLEDEKKTSAEAAMPITMKLVAAGLPGPAMLKNSSIQVSKRKATTGSTKPYRARGSGNLWPRPKVFWVPCQKVRRLIHSAKPPKGHIAHRAPRPAHDDHHEHEAEPDVPGDRRAEVEARDRRAEQADEDHGPEDDLVRQDQQELELPVTHRAGAAGITEKVKAREGTEAPGEALALGRAQPDRDRHRTGQVGRSVLHLKRHTHLRA